MLQHDKFKIVGLLARFFLQKNTSLFRPQFPLYRPNAKLAKQFRSVLSCEVVASKKNFVGNVLLLGFELSVKKLPVASFLAPAWKRASTRKAFLSKRSKSLSLRQEKKECVSILSFFSACAVMQYVSKIDASIRGSTTK